MCKAGLVLNPAWSRRTGGGQLSTFDKYDRRGLSELSIDFDGAFNTAAYYNNIPPTANCSRAKTDNSVPDDRFMTPADLGQTMTAKDERNRHELNRANHPDLEINDIRGLPYGCTYRASFPANWSWMYTDAAQQAALSGSTYVGALPSFTVKLSSTVVVHVEGKRSGGNCGRLG
jgi:hypothetical protein